MLPTESEGWNALHALKSLLSGRLARFKRHTLDDSRPHKSQNDAAFLETDLRYILTVPYPVIDLSESEFYDMHHKTMDLLTSLNRMVSQHLIEPRRKPASQQSIVPVGYNKTNLHDIDILRNEFPRLGALLSLPGTSLEQVDLINGPGITLFMLPQGEPRRLVIEKIHDWKNLLVRFIALAQNPRSYRIPAVSRSGPSPEVEIDTKTNRRQNNTSAIIDAILRDFKQHSCKEVHEIKFKVPEEWQTGERQSVLDMFVSSGPDGDLWKETQCNPLKVAVDAAARRSICAAIQQATVQNRKLYLSMDDDEGLFDISEQYPPKHSASDSFIVESLAQLFEQKIFTKSTYRDYVERTATAKMSPKEKAVLALGLARCLMDFIDGEADLAFFSWRPETIDFTRPSGSDASNRRLHIRLKPYIARPKQADVLRTVKPGNPILLSFAKLLLEIESGERIPMQIHSDNRENEAKWAELCGFVSEESMERDGDYIKAVEGCLYLHMALRKAYQEEKASHTGEILRTAIYEQIVKNLELLVDPPSSKRKRRDSGFDSRSPKKQSLLPSLPPDTITRGTMVHNHIVCAPDFSRPQSRHDFEFAIVCALPLEYDAVSLLFDEFWDEDCDGYGRAEGDPNQYTTGRIGKVNVVLVLLPSMGNVRAASTAASLRLSYPKVRVVLVSGICAGVPFPAKNEELILGDVVISRCVVQYDFGKEYPNEFIINETVEDTPGRAPLSIRNLLTLLQTNRARDRLEEMASLNLQQLQHKASQKSRGSKYQYPGTCEDRLFQSGYLHKHRQSFQCLCTRGQTADVSICQASRKLLCQDLKCDFEHLVPRKRLELKQKLEEGGRITEAQSPSIFVGRIGSANKVLKSGEERDRLAAQHDLIAFEMEGVGVWDEIPTIIVKAACDYADSHKNKLWQDFAAATAASVTKALLERYIQRDSPLKGAVR